MQHRAYWSQVLHEHLQLPLSHFTFLSETFERVPTTPQLDTWQVTDAELVRLHVKPRLKLFVPTPSKCPVDLSLLSVERCTHVEDVSGRRFQVNDVWQDVGPQPWGTSRWTGKTVFKISRDKRLHSQPLQSRNGKTASGAKSTGNPIVSFANTVDTVFYTDTEGTEETAYVVCCDQPGDSAGQMPSGPSKVGSCFIMPHDQTQRLKATLNYHPLSKSKDPEQRELYNFQKVLDQFLNDEDYVSCHKTPL
jgi:hypothetical protein